MKGKTRRDKADVSTDGNFSHAIHAQAARVDLYQGLTMHPSPGSPSQQVVAKKFLSQQILRRFTTPDLLLRNIGRERK